MPKEAIGWKRAFARLTLKPVAAGIANFALEQETRITTHPDSCHQSNFKSTLWAINYCKKAHHNDVTHGAFMYVPFSTNFKCEEKKIAEI